MKNPSPCWNWKTAFMGVGQPQHPSIIDNTLLFSCLVHKVFMGIYPLVTGLAAQSSL